VRRDLLEEILYPRLSLGDLERTLRKILARNPEKAEHAVGEPLR
jgi:hypothetical protein